MDMREDVDKKEAQEVKKIRETKQRSVWKGEARERLYNLHYVDAVPLNLDHLKVVKEITIATDMLSS